MGTLDIDVLLSKEGGKESFKRCLSPSLILSQDFPLQPLTSHPLLQVQLDIDRLPSRNLGRDDRIISSHSVESRYPFLALSFINYLSALPIERKMDLRYAEPRSETELARGDKMLLRLAARRLGLEGASGRKKRAMQFGSRSAKMEVEDKRGASGRKGWGAETIAPKGSRATQGCWKALD